MKTHKMTIDET